MRGSMSSLKFAPNPRRKSYRLAVVVSKKVSKSAVVRNRIRRRLYEAVRGLENDMNEPHDIVLTVFSEQMAEIPSNKLQSSVTSLLKQAKII